MFALTQLCPSVVQARASGDSDTWYAGASDLGSGWRSLDWLESFNVSQDRGFFRPSTAGFLGLLK